MSEVARHDIAIACRAGAGPGGAPGGQDYRIGGQCLTPNAAHPRDAVLVYKNLLDRNPIPDCGALFCRVAHQRIAHIGGATRGGEETPTAFDLGFHIIAP
ncbi:MAG: hypothetical protein BWY63_01318 [Chloroflexi bacterium ADurb.Bin360]|nr:MAG: hypothetical protein BWY63_01318 [Chloroflexi bacterium ADurb.Bin360]